MKPQKIILPLVAFAALVFIAFSIAAVRDFIPAYKIYSYFNSQDDNTKRLINMKLEEKQIPHVRPEKGIVAKAYNFTFVLPANRRVEMTKFGNSYLLDNKVIVLMPTNEELNNNNGIAWAAQEVNKIPDGMKALEKMAKMPIRSKYDLGLAEYTTCLKDLTLFSKTHNEVLRILLVGKSTATNTTALYRFDDGEIKGFQRITDSFEDVIFFDCKNPETFGYLSFVDKGKGTLSQAEIDAIIGSVEFDQTTH